MQIRKHAEGKGLKVGGREKLGIWTGGELAVIKNAVIWNLALPT